MTTKQKTRNHLKALTLPQLRALAIQRKVTAGLIVRSLSKEGLVALLTDVPDVLRPVSV